MIRMEYDARPISGSIVNAAAQVDHNPPLLFWIVIAGLALVAIILVDGPDLIAFVRRRFRS